MSKPINRELRQLIQPLLDSGWEYVIPKGGGHPRLVSPTGQRIYMASTPGNKRAWLNARADIRRAIRAEEAA